MPGSHVFIKHVLQETCIIQLSFWGVAGGGGVKSRFCGSGLNCASQWLCCVKKATEVTLVIWSKAPEKEQG